MLRSSYPALFLIAALILLASVSSPAQTDADYVITGRVVDESNRGVAGVWVFAKPHDYDLVQAAVRVARRALTDGDGAFSIPVGRPARYELIPEKSEAGYFIQFSPVFRHPAVRIVEVVLTETEKTASAVVTLAPKNGVLVGKSIDATTGRPIESLHFLFCLSSDPKVCWSTSAKNAKGEFKILTPHVPFTLRATADAYDNWFGLNGFQNNEPISIASGTTMEVIFHLKRRPEAVNRPLMNQKNSARSISRRPFNPHRPTGLNSRRSSLGTPGWNGNQWTAQWHIELKSITAMVWSRAGERVSILSHTQERNGQYKSSEPAMCSLLLEHSPEDGVSGQ